MTEGWLALLGTLGQPLTDPGSRTFAPWLLAAAVVALAWTARQGSSRAGIGHWLRSALAPGLWIHPSTRADLGLLVVRRLIAALRLPVVLGGALGVAAAVSGTLDRLLGIPEATVLPDWTLTAAYTLVLFVAWDLSRYAVHRLMHEVPALWAIHQVHHSAEVLTPLAFHRIHPLESLLYTLRGTLVTGAVAGLAFWTTRGAAAPLTLLGVHALGLGLNALFGNLRHSHVWISFGAAERWLISPAQHQLHHGADSSRCNYGTWLALWDRLGGTLRLADRPPEVFGLHPADRNHDPRDLWSLLVAPVSAAARALPMRAVAAALFLLVAGSAMAQESEDNGLTEEDWEDISIEVIVEAEDGVPRVAGSAHTVDEEQLDRFEHDDIHQVLAAVPGVYLRGEDGFGLRPNIGMRGGNADRSARIALMEDGIPLAPAPYAAPAAYYFPMPTRLVGVEVFKGPAAIRYGPQTVGGALNLRTRTVPRDGPDGAIDVALGLRKTATAHAWAGAGTSRAGFLVEGAHLSSGGFKVLDTGGPTGFDRQDLMLKGRLATARTESHYHAVQLKLGYGHEQSWETYLGLSGEDFEDNPYRRYAASDGDRMQWHRTQAELTWDARLGRHFELRLTGYHHFLTRAWFKVNRFAGGPDLHALLQQPASGQAAVYLGILRGEVDTDSPDQAILKGTNDRVFHAGGLQARARLTHADGPVRNELELGVRLHADRIRRVHTERPFDMIDGQLERSGPLDTTLDALSAADALAAHVHDRISVGRFDLIPGLRTEVIRTAQGDDSLEDPQLRAIPLPGFGALARTTDWLDVFVGVHRGFSPVPPGSAEAQRPETAWSYELGARAAPGATHLELVGFASDYTRLTGQCTLSSGCTEDQLDQQFDGGAATILGLESLAAHTWYLPGSVEVAPELSYTFTDARFRTAFVSGFPQFGSVQPGDFLPYVPMHQGAAQLAADHERVGLALSATGRSGLRDEASQGEVPEFAEIPPLITLDAAARFALTERVELYATGTNLGNAKAVESWRPFGARPVAPLQVMAGVKGRL